MSVGVWSRKLSKYLYILTGVVLGFAGLYSLVSLISPETSGKIPILSVVRFAVPIGIALSVIIPMIVRFLNTDNAYVSSFDDSFNKEKKRFIEKRNLEKKLDELIQGTVTVEKLQENVYKKTINNIEDTLLKRIEVKYEKQIKFDLKQTLISELLLPIIQSTEKYVFRLQRNSIVNLLIGIIATITAISVLAITILGGNNTGGLIEIKDFLIHFLPRLTFVIFIQLFAFFFLRLYKNNLEDVKYFQNELTNINSKTAAFKIAHILGNDSKIDEILKELSSTERNFKLLKDESMINLERAKIEKDVDLDMLASYRDFLKIYKKEKGDS